MGAFAGVVIKPEFRLGLDWTAMRTQIPDGLGSSVGVGSGFQVTDSFVLTLANDVHLALFFDFSKGAPTHAWFSNFNLGLLWN